MSFLNTVAVYCPYCGESIELVIDSSVSKEEYVEDCSVCCRPMVVAVTQDSGRRISVDVRTENE